LSRALVSPLLAEPVHTWVPDRFRAVWMAFHLWDLDAPAVAIAWQFLFARYLHVSIAWPAALALGLAVWLIYAGDRILDVRRPGSAPSTARHLFHSLHRELLTGLAVLALAALFVLTLLLRPVVVRSGFELAGCVAAYLACVHLVPGQPRRWFPKEVIVGLVFAAGTCLAPWSRAADRPALLLPGLFFALLCCLNCAIIEVWEWRDSGCLLSAHPHPSTVWLWRAVRPLLWTVAAGAALLLCRHPDHAVFSSLLLSACCILLLDLRKQRLSADLRRVLADAALLTPLLFLIAGA
jgi:hypothetical protein